MRKASDVCWPRPRKTARLIGGTVLAIAASGTVASGALASPGGGVTAETFVTGPLVGDVQQNSDRVKFQTKGDTLVRFQKLTFAPGGFTGWHHHPGVVIVTVQSGTLNLAHSDCTSHNYGPGSPHGQTFVEGEHRVHQATSTDGAVIFATYISSAIDPPTFRIEDAVPFCAQ